MGAAEERWLAEALSGLSSAVEDLGERDPISKLTYFEESPIKNGECHWRWVQLNRAQVAAKDALARIETRKGEKPQPRHD